MRDITERGWDERTVTVNRLKLLETLKANRQKHQTEYQESLAGYQEAAKKALEKQVRKAIKAIDNNAAMLSAKIACFDPDDPLSDQVIILERMSFTLQVPTDHTKSYDVAISMAEWEVRDDIELTQSQFQCFVMDDWEWKKSFDHLNKSYTGRA